MNIKNKNNFLSVYGFSCGYVEIRETDFINLELWKESNTYHVRHSNFYYNRTEWNKSPNYVWLSFESLTAAKKAFFNLCDKLNFKRVK